MANGFGVSRTQPDSKGPVLDDDAVKPMMYRRIGIPVKRFGVLV